MSALCYPSWTCNLLFVSLSNCFLDKLQKAQNDAIHIVFHRQKVVHITLLPSSFTGCQSELALITSLPHCATIVFITLPQQSPVLSLWSALVAHHRGEIQQTFFFSNHTVRNFLPLSLWNVSRFKAFKSSLKPISLRNILHNLQYSSPHSSILYPHTFVFFCFFFHDAIYLQTSFACSTCENAL